nr:hypothetical protein [uncultured Campylobacter sp.]
MRAINSSQIRPNNFYKFEAPKRSGFIKFDESKNNSPRQIYTPLALRYD